MTTNIFLLKIIPGSEKLILESISQFSEGVFKVFGATDIILFIEKEKFYSSTIIQYCVDYALIGFCRKSDIKSIINANYFFLVQINWRDTILFSNPTGFNLDFLKNTEFPRLQKCNPQIIEIKEFFSYCYDKLFFIESNSFIKSLQIIDLIRRLIKSHVSCFSVLPSVYYNSLVKKEDVFLPVMKFEDFFKSVRYFEDTFNEKLNVKIKFPFSSKISKIAQLFCEQSTENIEDIKGYAEKTRILNMSDFSRELMLTKINLGFFLRTLLNFRIEDEFRGIKCENSEKLTETKFSFKRLHSKNAVQVYSFLSEKINEFGFKTTKESTWQDNLVEDQRLFPRISDDFLKMNGDFEIPTVFIGFYRNIKQFILTYKKLSLSLDPKIYLIGIPDFLIHIVNRLKQLVECYFTLSQRKYAIAQKEKFIIPIRLFRLAILQRCPRSLDLSSTFSLYTTFEDIGSMPKLVLAAETIPNELLETQGIYPPKLVVFGEDPEFSQHDFSFFSINYEFYEKPVWWFGAFHECGHAFFKYLGQNSADFKKLYLKDTNGIDLDDLSIDDPMVKMKRFLEEIFSDYFDLVIGFCGNDELYFQKIWDYLETRKGERTIYYQARMLIVFAIKNRTQGFLSKENVEYYQKLWKNRDSPLKDKMLQEIASTEKVIQELEEFSVIDEPDMRTEKKDVKYPCKLSDLREFCNRIKYGVTSRISIEDLKEIRAKLKKGPVNGYNARQIILSLEKDTNGEGPNVPYYHAILSLLLLRLKQIRDYRNNLP